MKAEKKAIGVSQRHLYSRISFLYQAATHLMNARPDRGLGATTDNEFPGPVHSKSTIHQTEEAQDINVEASEPLLSASHSPPKPGLMDALGPSCHLISHLRSVSLKGQIRLSPAMKHSICKRCDALLVPGSTSSARVENKSRGGKKAWADVLIVTCRSCNAVKRFPVAAKRQRRRPQRASNTKLINKDPKLVWKQTEILAYD